LPRLPNGIYGRADDMFVVRGENVYPSAIEDVIRAIPGCGDEFRIIITREKTMDELVLQVEHVPDATPQQVAQTGRKLAAGLQTRGLRTAVRMMAPGSLERTQFKARRIIDQRGLYDEIVKKG